MEVTYSCHLLHCFPQTVHSSLGCSTKVVGCGKVSEDTVRAEADNLSQMSITSNYSISLRVLRVNEARSYVCRKDGNTINKIYLSLAKITSLSIIISLQLGGKLILICILFIYPECSVSAGWPKMIVLSPKTAGFHFSGKMSQLDSTV